MSGEHQSLSGAVTGIAKDAMDSIKGHPILVVVLILNMIFVATGWHVIESASDRKQEYILELLQRCSPKYQDRAPAPKLGSLTVRLRSYSAT